MESRWQFSFTQEQMNKLIYVSFAKDDREVPEKLPEEAELAAAEVKSKDKQDDTPIVGGTDLEKQRQKFWSDFIEYCNEQGYGKLIAKRETTTECWYAVSLGTADLHIEFTVTRSKYLTILIYAENTEVFTRLEGKKNEIEKVFGDKLDWYSSRQGSDAKRILYKKECNVFDSAIQEEHFDWLIEKFLAMYNALKKVNEIDGEISTNNSFT